MWRQSCCLLNTTLNFLLSNTGYPASKSKHTIRVIISPICLPQQETWTARWWCLTARLCHSQTKVSQMSTHTAPVYLLSTVKQSLKPNQIFYQTVLGASPPNISPLECLLPRSHTCPVAFWLLSTPEAHITQRHIRCLSGMRSGITLHRTSVHLSKPSDTTHSACKTYGTIWLQLQTSSTLRTDDKRWATTTGDLSLRCHHCRSQQQECSCLNLLKIYVSSSTIRCDQYVWQLPQIQPNMVEKSGWSWTWLDLSKGLEPEPKSGTSLIQSTSRQQSALHTVSPKISNMSRQFG